MPQAVDEEVRRKERLMDSGGPGAHQNLSCCPRSESLFAQTRTDSHR